MLKLKAKMRAHCVAHGQTVLVARIDNISIIIYLPGLNIELHAF